MHVLPCLFATSSDSILIIYSILWNHLLTDLFFFVSIPTHEFRSLEALVEIWDEQIRPSITAFVNSQKSKEEKRDFVRKADYEKYDVGILHAAARSQYLGMQVPQGTDE